MSGPQFRTEAISGTAAGRVVGELQVGGTKATPTLDPEGIALLATKAPPTGVYETKSASGFAAGEVMGKVHIASPGNADGDFYAKPGFALQAVVEQVKASLDRPSLEPKGPFDVEGQQLFLTELDLLLDSHQAETLRECQRLLSRADASLLGLTAKDKLVRWHPAVAMDLTYAVVESSFSGPISANAITTMLQHAGSDWAAICGVQFRQVESSASPLFTVRYLNTTEPTLHSTLAASFFPNEKPERRILYILPAFHSGGNIGVLRHELGHILGFRHEHIRITFSESLHDTTPLSAYDKYSVMHYRVAGGGTHDMHITDKDAEGARRVYGPPLALCEFFAK